MDNKKITKKQICLETINMNDIYKYLTLEEKSEDYYRTMLDNILSSSCKNYLVTPKALVYGSWVRFKNDEFKRDIKMNKEFIVDRIDYLKKRFKYFKESELEAINKDLALTSIKRQSFIEQLEFAINNINLKLNFLIKEFQNDIDSLNLELSKIKPNYIPVNEVSNVKRQIKESRLDIDATVNKLVCNNVDLLEIQKLRPLNSIYSSIIEETITNNIKYITDSLLKSDFKSLSKFLVKEINKGIRGKKLTSILYPKIQLN